VEFAAFISTSKNIAGSKKMLLLQKKKKAANRTKLRNLKKPKNSIFQNPTKKLKIYFFHYEKT
jgi:hypothetical protein